MVILSQVHGIVDNRLYRASQNHRYMAIHTVTNPTSTAGYQHRFDLKWLPGMRKDFSDVLVMLPDGTKCPHWVETSSSVSGYSTVVWSKNPLANAGVFLIFYGRNGGYNLSNGKNTFDLFYDFDGVSLDTGEWTSVAGTPAISGGIINFHSGSNAVAIKSNTTFGTNTAIMAYCSPYYGNANAGTGTGILQYGTGTDTTALIRFQNGEAFFATQNFNDAGSANTLNFPVTRQSGYKKYEIIRNSTTSIIFNINDVIQANHTTNIPTIARSVLFYNDRDNHDYLCDWVAARKYTATEPTTVLSWYGKNPYYDLRRYT